jgi:hypothetical protein
MKKIIIKIVETIKSAWKAETPELARMAQLMITLISAISLYISSLTDEFKSSIDLRFFKILTYIGITAIVFLNFTKKKK